MTVRKEHKRKENRKINIRRTDHQKRKLKIKSMVLKGDTKND